MATALCQICFLQFRISRQVAFLFLDKGPLAYRRIALTNIKIHWYSFLHLGGEGHCTTFQRPQCSDHAQGSNPGSSTWTTGRHWFGQRVSQTVIASILVEKPYHDMLRRLLNILDDMYSWMNQWYSRIWHSRHSCEFHWVCIRRHL